VKLSEMTARQMFYELRANPDRPRYGFGSRPMLVNVDLQNAYTDVGKYITAYDNDPRQMDHVNDIADCVRAMGLPVVWTYCAFMASGEDCGVFGSRTDTPDSLKNIKFGSHRAEIDPRLVVRDTDIVLNKKMPSAFHETYLASLAVYHKVDTVIVTGGSTSGCVRATVVDSVSHGYRTVVPEECVADLHESPHFANLYDMMKKYADVVPVSEVLARYRT